MLMRELSAGHVQVAGRGGQAATADRELDGADVDAGLEQMRLEGMEGRLYPVAPFVYNRDGKRWCQPTQKGKCLNRAIRHLVCP